MEDDLATGKRPAPGDGKQLTYVGRRQIGEQRPVHCAKSE